MMAVMAYIVLSFGVVFVLLAGVGLMRMPTFFMRMQVTSKASTLGVLLMLLGLCLLFPTWEMSIKSVLLCVFLILTAPIAAHALALSATKRNYDD